MVLACSERDGEKRKQHHRRSRRIGGRKTIVQEFPNLPSALPSRLIVKGARYGEVPGTLRSRITFAMGTDILGDLINPKNAGFVLYAYVAVSSVRYCIGARCWVVETH